MTTIASSRTTEASTAAGTRLSVASSMAASLLCHQNTETHTAHVHDRAVEIHNRTTMEIRDI